MGFPGLDVIFRLASPAIDLFVEPAWRALFEIGDDEAGVGTLVADFNPGDDPLDAAPTFRAVVEGLEAARLAIVGRGLEARFGAGFEIGNMAPQCRGRRDAQDEVVPAGTTPVDDLRAAIVAVAAQQDFGFRPVCVDRTHQTSQERPDFRALWPLGWTQNGGDEAAFPIEHDDGLEAILVIMGIEQAQLLAAMHGVKRVIDVDDNALGHGGEAVAIQIDHGPAHAQQRARIGQVFQTRDCRLRTQSAVRRGKVERHLEHRIDAQTGGIIAILITCRDHHQPEVDNVGKTMRDMLRRAWILDTGR